MEEECLLDALKCGLDMLRVRCQCCRTAGPDSEAESTIRKGPLDEIIEIVRADEVGPVHLILGRHLAGRQRSLEHLEIVPQGRVHSVLSRAGDRSACGWSPQAETR